MKHIVNVSLLFIGVTAILLFLLHRMNLMPVAASAEAGPIDWLFGLHLDIITVLYVLVNGILLYSVFVFRRKKNDESEGAYFHSNQGLEIGWTIVPLIVVMIFAVLGAGVLHKTTAASPDEMEVKVTARQWSWLFEYPKEGITSTELTLPVNKRVNLILESTDVTHSFWVPEFRVKQDTVPGQIKHLRITPTLVGSYKVRCAELCGTSHAYMEAPVNVLSAADYDIWVQKQLGTYVEPGAEGPAEQTPADRGQKLAVQKGCTGCHSADGAVGAGPTWKGLYGESVKLADGSSVTADDAYLHESIVNPSTQLAAGFTDIMPKTFGQTLSEDQIKDLIEYIKSLK